VYAARRFIVRVGRNPDVGFETADAVHDPTDRLCQRRLAPLSFYFIQFVTGLASACSLFLVASGLSIIFGVTRIVNFAHGAFYMLGAYVGFTLTDRLGGAVGFWGGLLLAAIAVAAIGTIVEIVLLRRIYAAPELFQLLATFGVTLAVEDLVLLIWGPNELLGPRAPGFKGAIDIFGRPFPSYDALLIVLGPLVLGLLWLLFRQTRWGVLVRAATQDREMVAALGVDQKWLFTSVFALGVFLAALGGALELPREAANHTMDLQVITEALVVVVIGGLGSVPGTFLAAIIVSELNAFGILAFPGISLVLVFLVMAVVLVLRPWGLLGRPETAVRAPAGAEFGRWRPLSSTNRLAICVGLAIAAGLPLVAGNYFIGVATEVLIFVLFAASLHFLIGAGGLVSFGHAAYFGLGSYGAALALKLLGLGMEAALVAGVGLGLAGALLFGWFCVRLSGVYFAMLTLAFAQIAWSVAFQWTDVTGGDNGIIGVWPSAWAATASHFYWLTLALASGGVALLRVILFSPFGYGLRGLRDSPLRAETIGLERRRLQWVGFAVAGAFAALAGALYAFLKGSVFPDNLGIALSIDGLVMVLLGGVDTVSGGVAGAALYKSLSIWVISHTDYSRLVIGVAIVLLVVLFPKGLVGALQAWRSARDEEARP
jgi:branched-chain amino acid transport system permease protein